MNIQSPLSKPERIDLFKQAAAMPQKLEKIVSGKSEEELKRKQPDIEFSIHQQVWHLADLEVEGFSKRIQSLLKNSNPELSDFDGSCVASTRDYHSIPIQQGLRAFADTRLLNLWLLSGVGVKQWLFSGQQQNVGKITLVDVFRSMVAHDKAHLIEIEILMPNVNAGQNLVSKDSSRLPTFAAA